MINKKLQFLLVIASIGTILYVTNPSTTADSFLKFRPKEFDVTIGTSAKNCQNLELLEGLCQGGNWAQIFAQALHLSKCFNSSTLYPILSYEELLQCVSFSDDKCSTIPSSVDLVDNIRSYLVNSGLTQYSCQTYKQTLNFHLKSKCSSKCDDLSAKTVVAQAEDVVAFASDVAVTDIQDFIISNKQAIVAVNYGESLNQYYNGVYNSVEGELNFGVRFLLLVGWSTSSDGQVQWKALNTFGSQYGQNGRVSLPSSDPSILNYYGIIPV